MLQVVTSDNLVPSNEGRDPLTARLKQLTLLKYKQVYCFFYHWQWKGMTYCLGNTTVDMKNVTVLPSKWIKFHIMLCTDAH